MNLEPMMACLAAVAPRSGFGNGPARRLLALARVRPGSAPSRRWGMRAGQGHPLAPDTGHPNPGP
jgi:hypothetical protein